MKALKMVFVCGSLEPGHNGVGDYARRLAAELRRHGHETYLLSLYDWHVRQPTEEWQPQEGQQIPAYRLPAKLSAPEQDQLAAAWVAGIAPDWLSLQFVPYAFHVRGHAHGLPARLRQWGNYAWHLMIHELWIGLEGRPWRIADQQLQRLAVHRLRRTLRPAVVHTHLPLYRHRLEKVGFSVRMLPLFSNIAGEADVVPTPRNSFTIGIFSQVNHLEKMTDFLRAFHTELQAHQRNLSVRLVGGSPSRMQAVADFLIKALPDGVPVSLTGFLSMRGISEAIQACDMGLTPVHRHLLGKSGSAAAFLAHGIPLAAPVLSASNMPGFAVPACTEALVTQPTLRAWEAARPLARLAAAHLHISRINQCLLADISSTHKITRICEASGIRSGSSV